MRPSCKNCDNFVHIGDNLRFGKCTRNKPEGKVLASDWCPHWRQKVRQKEPSLWEIMLAANEAETALKYYSLDPEREHPAPAVAKCIVWLEALEEDFGTDLFQEMLRQARLEFARRYEKKGDVTWLSTV